MKTINVNRVAKFVALISLIKLGLHLGLSSLISVFVMTREAHVPYSTTLITWFGVVVMPNRARLMRGNLSMCLRRLKTSIIVLLIVLLACNAQWSFVRLFVTQ